jgi:predicted GIY-YIG superfamily endonuclease
MPRHSIDYSKTIIYKIQHNDNEELLYVGHTTDFIKRKSKHKNNCKSYQLKVYQMIRGNGGWECFNMVMVEEYPCVNKLQACRREDEVMRELKATMNTNGAVLDKNKILEYQKKWREENRDKLIEYTCQYRAENRYTLLEKKKIYYQANKEKIIHKQREKNNAKKQL